MFPQTTDVETIVKLQRKEGIGHGIGHTHQANKNISQEMPCIGEEVTG